MSQGWNRWTLLVGLPIEFYDGNVKRIEDSILVRAKRNGRSLTPVL